MLVAVVVMSIAVLVAATVLLASIVVVAVKTRAVHRKASSDSDDGTDAPLGPYDLAYLAGGPLRTVNTAICVLVGAKSVRVARDGQISRVAGAPKPSKAIEQEIVRTLRALGGTCSVAKLRHVVGAGSAVRDLHGGLQKRGLAKGWHVKSEVSGMLDGVVMLGHVVLVPVVVLMSFISRGLSPAEREAPAVDFGMWSLLVFVISLLIAVFACCALRWIARRTLNRAGHRAVAEAREIHARGVRPATSGRRVSVAAFPIALYGLSELGDPPLERALSRPRPWLLRIGPSCAVGTCGGGLLSGGGGVFGREGWRGSHLTSGRVRIRGLDGDGGCAGGCGGGDCGGGCGGD